MRAGQALRRLLDSGIAGGSGRCCDGHCWSSPVCSVCLSGLFPHLPNGHGRPSPWRRGWVGVNNIPSGRTVSHGEQANFTLLSDIFHLGLALGHWAGSCAHHARRQFWPLCANGAHRCIMGPPSSGPEGPPWPDSPPLTSGGSGSTGCPGTSSWAPSSRWQADPLLRLPCCLTCPAPCCISAALACPGISLHSGHVLIPSLYRDHAKVVQ